MQKQEGQPDQQGGAKGKGKGGKNGKGKGKGGKGSPKPAEKNKKTVLCKHYKDTERHGRCDKGKACPYSHDKRSFDSSGKFIGKTKNRQGGQGTVDAEGWDEPVGLSSRGPQIVRLLDINVWKMAFEFF